MIVVSPNHHPQADKVWRELLGSKPNGARTLGTAQEKYLADVFEPYYDMLVTYASDYPFEIPEGVKRIAIMWHQNYPWTEGFKVWQRVNCRLKSYEVDYFVNEEKLLSLIEEVGGRAYFFPRFIDTKKYPKFNCTKNIPTLWFGNPWREFSKEFEGYKLMNEHPWWICHGELGYGDEKKRALNRRETLQFLARAKEVWAIGISQLEAQYYGAEIVSYRGDVLPFYDEKMIVEEAKKLLGVIYPDRLPGLGE